MTNAAALRDRAAKFRDHAREYDPGVARPLLDKARELDFEAAMLERAGRERRLPRLTGRDVFLEDRPVFGKLGRS